MKGYIDENNREFLNQTFSSNYRRNIIDKLISFLFQAVSIADEDIKRQEDRVALARKKLQDALRSIPI